MKVKLDDDLKEIAAPFLNNRRKELIELQKLLAASDFIAIQNIAHKLKGNAGSYGFDALGELGARLEKGAKAKDSKAVQDCLTSIETFLATVEIC